MNSSCLAEPGRTGDRPVCDGSFEQYPLYYHPYPYETIDSHVITGSQPAGRGGRNAPAPVPMPVRLSSPVLAQPACRLHPEQEQAGRERAYVFNREPCGVAMVGKARRHDGTASRGRVHHDRTATTGGSIKTGQPGAGGGTAGIGMMIREYVKSER